MCRPQAQNPQPFWSKTSRNVKLHKGGVDLWTIAQKRCCAIPYPPPLCNYYYGGDLQLNVLNLHLSKLYLLKLNFLHLYLRNSVFCVFSCIMPSHPLILQNGWPKICCGRIWKSTKSCKTLSNLATYIRSLFEPKGGRPLRGRPPFGASIREV